MTFGLRQAIEEKWNQRGAPDGDYLKRITAVIVARS